MPKSDTFDKIKALVAERRVLISLHGYDELAADDILFGDLLSSVMEPDLVEDYPAASKGPSILLLQRDGSGKPVHAVWGIPKGRTEPAVLITAYRPDANRWSEDYKERRR